MRSKVRAAERIVCGRNSKGDGIMRSPMQRTLHGSNVCTLALLVQAVACGAAPTDGEVAEELAEESQALDSRPLSFEFFG